MQTIITYFTLLLTGLFMHGQNTIEVSMSGFDNNDGTAMIAVYDSEENFLKKRLLGEISKIEDSMHKLARDLKFEEAAAARDQLLELKELLKNR